MSKILDTSNCKHCAYRSWAFNKLDQQALEKIDSHKTEVFYEKGEVICTEGEEVNSFLYLRKGLVKLLTTEKNEKEHIISIGKPLDFIGLLSIFSNSNHIYTITAIEDSVVCFVDLEVIKGLMRQNGKFALDFLEKSSRVADDVINTRISINTKQLRGRIAYILLFFANHIYNTSEYELPISRKELAQLIDMSTENVIRILSEFRKDKLIEIEGKLIRILDGQRLQRIYDLG
ncbi:MAG: Crp/Fnr family transcriptional regulator [Bacteroidales bacterium]|nr:Crp/Fnr family transcriptional regulator [Bacteroidales bacterium]